MTKTRDSKLYTRNTVLSCLTSRFFYRAILHFSIDLAVLEAEYFVQQQCLKHERYNQQKI